jgi:hypothetical protein
MHTDGLLSKSKAMASEMIAGLDANGNGSLELNEVSPHTLVL